MSLSNKPSHLATYKDVAMLFLKHGRKAVKESDQLMEKFEIDSDIEVSDDAEEFVKDLENLGPTFIKLGQLLSTRPDLLPSSWLIALQRLQDDVKPFSYEEVQQIVESELGVKISKAFDSFDEKPLATASLGQVHRAVLRSSGKEVAVKIQRPKVRGDILKELDAISEVADFLDKHTKFGEQYEPGRIVSQFRRSLLRELNYLEEASNLNRLATNLSQHSEIVIPKPISDYCTDKVLTMEFVSGTKITDLSGVVHTDLNGGALAEALFSSYLKQVLVDGFFHADPHPGNLLLTADRKIALLDLGMVGVVPDRLKDLLLQLLSAVSEGQSSKAADAAIRIGTPKKDYNEAEASRKIRQIVEDRQGASIADMQVGQLVLEVTQTCAENGLSIPDEMFLLGKMLLNLDLIAKTLDPDFDPDASIRRQSSILANQRIKDELSIGNLIHLLTDVKDLITNSPQRLNDFFKNLGNNQLRVKVDAIDEQLLLRGFQQVANRITTGLILAALIIGAAMLMDIESKFTLFGYPGLAIIFFLAAAIGGTVLVARIIITEMKD
ncbi:MAG: ABC1 kinase family protein [Akkermansiaceae bacterium]